MSRKLACGPGHSSNGKKVLQIVQHQSQSPAAYLSYVHVAEHQD